jgi:hypothetical protein
VVTGSVIEPDRNQSVILATKLTPVAQRALGKRGQLIGELARQHGNHSWIAGRFLILRQRLQHYHAWPPVVVAARADHFVACLVRQSPLGELLCFGLQAIVVQQIGERNKPVKEIGTTFPGLTGSTKSAAICAHIDPRLIEVATQAICLDLQLLLQPS